MQKSCIQFCAFIHFNKAAHNKHTYKQCVRNFRNSRRISLHVHHERPNARMFRTVLNGKSAYHFDGKEKRYRQSSCRAADTNIRTVHYMLTVVHAYVVVNEIQNTTLLDIFENENERMNLFIYIQ